MQLYQKDKVGLANTGSNWKPRILSFIFSREGLQMSAWKYLFCAQQVLGVFIFLNLFSAGIYLLKVRLKGS